MVNFAGDLPFQPSENCGSIVILLNAICSEFALELAAVQQENC
jgi:hypothetical protein